MCCSEGADRCRCAVPDSGVQLKRFISSFHWLADRFSSDTPRTSRVVKSFCTDRKQLEYFFPLHTKTFRINLYPGFKLTTSQACVSVWPAGWRWRAASSLCSPSSGTDAPVSAAPSLCPTDSVWAGGHQGAAQPAAQRTTDRKTDRGRPQTPVIRASKRPLCLLLHFSRAPIYCSLWKHVGL